MKSVSRLIVIAALVVLGTARLYAASEEGVALAIVYDTSGSMKDPVKDSNGKPTPKYIIANRALVAVARQIQAYATNTAGNAPRKIEAGLFIFQGNNVKEAVKFAPFDAAVFEDFARRFANPNGNTPLGSALAEAGRAVLTSPLSRKHVLLITDGMNTAGPAPNVTLPRLKEAAARKQTSVATHFVAFDVEAKVFDAVKRLGATVVGAADEKQLNTQLDFILKRQILLEDEEPRKP